MTKKNKERKVNVSSKPKHSLDVNRKDGGKSDSRSAATVRRLKMYNNRPKLDRKGKILSHELQYKELPSTRIQPDRRWFEEYKEMESGNCRGDRWANRRKGTRLRKSCNWAGVIMKQA